MFHLKRDPETKKPLADASDYAHFRMNPRDNAANLPAEYIRGLEGLSVRMRRRFLEGEWGDGAPGALWTEEMIDSWREDSLPEMVRIVVAVDPSGADDEDNAHNDAIGIIVAGLGTDGNAYVIEDCTVKAGPKTWGNLVTGAFDRHAADKIIGEVNYGGEMVKFVVQTAKPGVPFKKITATRGKSVRAEPISALTEKGKIRFGGTFPMLEEELCSFTTHGYTGSDSPNRADAFVFAMSELFPGIVKEEKPKAQASQPWKMPTHGSQVWAA
ncbi:MAG: DNA-packaging protein [Nitrospiraceae bacterium]|nr:DNA-packaging protein [Nitrospiraceae bacterium]